MFHTHHTYLISRFALPFDEGDGETRYWCLGGYAWEPVGHLSPLQAILRFSKLLSNPINARAATDEISETKEQIAVYVTSYPDVSPEFHPSNYTVGAFIQASKIDLDTSMVDPYPIVQGRLSPAAKFDEEVPDGGWSVIDVTDPLKFKYCFIQQDPEDKKNYLVYSAREWVDHECARAHFPPPTAEEVRESPVLAAYEQFNNSLLKQFDEFDVLECGPMREVWPDELWEEESKKSDARRISRFGGGGEAYQHLFDTPSVITPIPSPYHVNKVQSSQLAINLIPAAVKKAIEDEDVSALEHMVVPDKVEAFRQALISCKLSPFPDFAIPFLTAVIDMSMRSVPHTLDLSELSLSDAQICRMVGELQNTSKVETVDLSHSPASMTLEAVRAVLKTLPSVKRLILLDTALSVLDIGKFLWNDHDLLKRLDFILHPFFYSPEQRASNDGFGCAIVSTRMDLGDMVYGPSAPYLSLWSPASVVEHLNEAFDFLFLNPRHQSTLMVDHLITSNLVELLFASPSRRPEQSWAERDLVAVPTVNATPFTGVGWTFAYILTGDHHAPHDRGCFGFVKVLEPFCLNHDFDFSYDTLPPMKICDVDEWLVEMEKDKRPLPTQEAVEKLKAHMASANLIECEEYAELALVLLAKKGMQALVGCPYSDDEVDEHGNMKDGTDVRVDEGSDSESSVDTALDSNLEGYAIPKGSSLSSDSPTTPEPAVQSIEYPAQGPILDGAQNVAAGVPLPGAPGLPISSRRTHVEDMDDVPRTVLGKRKMTITIPPPTLHGPVDAPSPGAPSLPRKYKPLPKRAKVVIKSTVPNKQKRAQEDNDDIAEPSASAPKKQKTSKKSPPKRPEPSPNNKNLKGKGKTIVRESKSLESTKGRTRSTGPSDDVPPTPPRANRKRGRVEEPEAEADAQTGPRRSKRIRQMHQ